MKRLTLFLLTMFCSVVLVYGQAHALQNDLCLKYLIQMPAQKLARQPVIILLHGYGSDERDLFELRNSFPKKYLVVAARAPYALPGGGYQWYESISVNGHKDGGEDQLANSRHLIQQFIGQIAHKYRADSKQVYLIGFSQGAVMCYEVGLTAPDKIKGIAALSGTIYAPLRSLVKATAILNQLKIFISHGTIDERIPFSEGKAANDYLVGLGLKPEFHQYRGMGHSINNNVLNDLLEWMK